MDRLYMVAGEFGECDDHVTWVDSLWTTRQAAEDRVKAIQPPCRDDCKIDRKGFQWHSSWHRTYSIAEVKPDSVLEDADRYDDDY